MGRSRKVIPFPQDPLKSASVAGLRYVLDEGPGITRVKKRDTFEYFDPDGKKLTDEGELKRIRSLVIPPAWTEVWICPSASGHLQAVGRDAKGRKQYRYHPEYRKVRDQTKFGRMLAFGAALPKIRKRVEDDLNLPGLPKSKVLATAVRLLERTCMRVGNDEYAKENCSYGLTTLHDKHVDISGSKIRFHFRGKSGQAQDIELSDPRLAKIVKQCRDIPGYELFQYVDEAGNHCRIDSADVNEYLREITGEEFTAKDFRTWGGTGLAALAFEELGKSENGADSKKNIVAAIKTVAERLGNRPATCRKYYVHPAIIDAYVDGSLLEILQTTKCDRREEDCVMKVVTRYIENLTIPEKAAEHLTRQLKQSIQRRA
ncbi:MAG TPA: hypothetical protein VMZ52_05385 [Bryobacteraceae bacterium]|nr:hypothetical protein [Bryobacteraceae bacterium]